MTNVSRNSRIQGAKAEKLKGLQLELLRKQVERVYRESKFYREKFDDAGVKPSQIKSLKDITKLPFTSREELEENFFDILAVPYSKVATIRLSSGTTGHPLRIAYTKKDMEMLTEASTRKLTYHGVTDRDIVQITAAYGLWQGAWSAQWGAERIGACVIPVGPAETERQILLIKQFKTSVLYATTNYHFRVLEVSKALGEDLSKHNLRLGICAAEKPSKTQISVLKKELGYEKVVVDYGATEFPGFSVNCEKDEDTHHVWADYYLVEVVNPATHEALGEGEKGELVVTSLQAEAFPLIRYLSRDISKYLGFQECDCGLTHPKIGAEIEREDFMTKIRGVTVFPSHVEFLLSKFPELTGKCQVIVDKRTPKHEAALRVETKSALSQSAKKSLKAEIVDKIKNRVGITFNEVVFVPFGQFEKSFKKAVVIM